MLLIKFCWCWCWLCRWWWWWCWWYWWWWIAALCAVNYFQYALLGSVRLTKWAEMLRLSTGADLNNLPLPTGPSWTLSCMVGFWHWHIPTFIITDIFPPWWDFVMVGICWVTMTIMLSSMMTMTMSSLWEGCSRLYSCCKSWWRPPADLIEVEDWHLSITARMMMMMVARHSKHRNAKHFRLRWL